MSSPETHDVSDSPETISAQTRGRVKWFNNRAGYGFITVSSGEQKGTDVFVHHSAIQVKQEQYRYLVQGEYVDFKLCEVAEPQQHKWQAGEVCGVDGERLMCETRLETRATRMARKDTSTDGSRPQTSRPVTSRSTEYSTSTSNATHYRVRTRGPGPREGDEWMLVRRKAPSRDRGTTTHSPSREVMRPRNAERGNYRSLNTNGDN